MNARTRRTRGFTLIETLVAVTLLALLLSALMPVFQQGLDALRIGGAHARAVMLAESLLDRAAVGEGGEPELAVDDRGESLGMRWEVSRTPYVEDAIGALPEDGPLRLVDVTVRVTWGDRERQLVLRTLSLETPP